MSPTKDSDEPRVFPARVISFVCVIYVDARFFDHHTGKLITLQTNRLYGSWS